MSHFAGTTKISDGIYKKRSYRRILFSVGVMHLLISGPYLF